MNRAKELRPLGGAPVPNVLTTVVTTGFLLIGEVWLKSGSKYMLSTWYFQFKTIQKKPVARLYRRQVSYISIQFRYGVQVTYCLLTDYLIPTVKL
jgi:hypothetical protein